MPLDLRQLDVIEEKLAIGFPLSVDEDIEPVENLVTSFRRIWQWYNEYPEFNSKLQETLFRTVFDDMSSKFRSTNSDVMSEDDKNDSNSPSSVYDTNSKSASHDVCFSNSNMPFKDDGRDSNVDNTNSEKISDGDCRPNVDAGSMANSENTISIFHLECGLCNSEFPLLNNDPTYAYQMHAQKSEHIETIAALERLNSLSVGNTASTSNVDVGNASSADNASNVSVDSLQSVASAPTLDDITELNVSSKPYVFSGNQITFRTNGFEFLYGVTSNVRQRRRRHREQQSQKESSTSMSKANEACKEDKWIQKKGKGKYCILCNVDLPGQSQLRAHTNGQTHQQDSPWVEILVGNKYSCTLCNVVEVSLDQLYDHLHGKKHNQKAEDRQKQTKTVNRPNASLSSNSTNISYIPITSPMNLYRANCQTRMAYFLNKSCIISVASQVVGETVMVTSCYLCDHGWVDESHLFENTHRSKVAAVIKKSNPKTASFELGVVNLTRGKKGMKCYVCGYNVSDDPCSYFTHVTQQFHKQRVRQYFLSSRYKDWEKGIVLREGKPYCVFCQLILPTEKSMLEHLDDPAHKIHCN